MYESIVLFNSRSIDLFLSNIDDDDLRRDSGPLLRRNGIAKWRTSFV